MTNQIIATMISGIIALVIFFTINSFLDRAAREKSRRTRASLIRKILNTFTILIFLLAILAIWGVNFENIWIFLTGIITLIAIAFFAVWSLLSNIIASVMIFITRPFRIGDQIRIPQEKIKGKLIHIGAVFTTIKNQKGELIQIPNNMLFQRVIAVKRK